MADQGGAQRQAAAFLGGQLQQELFRSGGAGGATYLAPICPPQNTPQQVGSKPQQAGWVNSPGQFGGLCLPFGFTCVGVFSCVAATIGGPATTQGVQPRYGGGGQQGGGGKFGGTCAGLFSCVLASIFGAVPSSPLTCPQGGPQGGGQAAGGQPGYGAGGQQGGGEPFGGTCIGLFSCVLASIFGAVPSSPLTCPQGSPQGGGQAAGGQPGYGAGGQQGAMGTGFTYLNLCPQIGAAAPAIHATGKAGGECLGLFSCFWCSTYLPGQYTWVHQ